MTITAAHFKAARNLLGWSQSRLAGEAGVSATTVGYIEGGGRPAPASTVLKVRQTLEAAGVEFTNGREPGVRMRNDLIKLQFRNAQLRGKITTALKRADDALQHADDERAKLLVRVSEDSVETLADVFENLRGRALALVKAGVAKRGDFPEIG
jgi:transcriptional regulator with XRE-family HTH domain